MFVREKTSPTTKRTYLQIVKSYRENGRVRQKVLGSLGCLQELKNSDELEKIAKGLLGFLEKERSLYDLSTAKENARYNWGAVAVFKKLWNLFELGKLLEKLGHGKKVSFDYFSAIFLMLLDRSICPSSKLRSFNTQDKYLGIDNSNLHHLYRSLDILAGGKEEIEKWVFEKNRSLFNMSVDVVFFDNTTFYFESQERSELKDFGYSKDLKVNETQVLFSLIIDKNGRPIGFEVFNGSTFEGKTVKETIDKLKTRFNIEKLIFVGDRGIFSKNTFTYLKEAGYEYIISSRVRKKSATVTEAILKGGWDHISEGNLFKYKELEDKGNRLIITYSQERAEHDKKLREKLIEKAKELLANGKTTYKNGARKYLKVSAQEVILDEDKVAADSHFDGFYGIETNNEKLTPEEIIEKYKELWRIEEAFRVFKNHLETRPMFHYSDKRIKGHLVLCFLAFLLERTLELEMKKSDLNYSPAKLRDILTSLEVSEVEVEKQRFFLRANLPKEAKELLKVLKIKSPSNLTTKEELLKIVV